jgi:hypothetical protein
VNPLGVKGLAEIAIVGVAPAIANAVFHDRHPDPVAPDHARCRARGRARGRALMDGGNGRPSSANGGRQDLDHAFDRLEAEVPDRVSRAIRWLRDPKGRWVRIPLGLLLIAGSALAVLPVFGIEMLPLGLMLIALDIPFLRGPVGRAMLWLEDRWAGLRRWWRERRRRRDRGQGRDQGPDQGRDRGREG